MLIKLQKNILLCFVILTICINSDILIALDTLQVSTINDYEFQVYNDISGITISTTFFKDKINFDLDSLLIELSPSLLRFPSGSHAMRYDWEQGIYEFKGPTKGNKENQKLKIDSFINMADRYDSEIIYIVNVFQDSPRKTARLARFIQSKQFNVKYWELGNEASGLAFKDKFKSAADYLKTAKAHADSIWSIFPEAAIGLSARDQKKKFNKWNKILSKQKWCDNIIFHRYHGINKEKRKNLRKNEKTINNKTVYKKMLTNTSKPNIEYAEIFPGKNFWITEWNTTYVNMDIKNSMADIIWMGRTFIQYLRTPDIKLACFWNMNMKTFGLLHIEDDSLLIDPAFYAFEKISNIIKKSKKSISLSFSNTINMIDHIMGQQFITSSQSGFFMIINPLDRDYYLQFNQDYRIFNRIEIISYDKRQYNFDNLANYDLLFNKEKVRIKEIDFNSNRILLEKHSVMFLEYDEKKNLPNVRKCEK